MRKYQNNKGLLHLLLSVLQHGDRLRMRELAEYLEISRYRTQVIVQNYRKYFDIHKGGSGKGSGSGIKRLYSLSNEGRVMLWELQGGEGPYTPPPPTGIQVACPLLTFLHTKVFRPYIELSNTGGQFAKQRHYRQA